MRRLLVAMALVVVAACGGSGDSVEGRLISFDGDLTSVRSFSVVAPDGRTFDFVPSAGATFHGGPLGHLRDHLVSGEPIVVFFEESNGVLTATSVEDA